MIDVGDTLKIIKFIKGKGKGDPKLFAVVVECNGKNYELGGCYGEGLYISEADERIERLLKVVNEV